MQQPLETSVSSPIMNKRKTTPNSANRRDLVEIVERHMRDPTRQRTARDERAEAIGAETKTGCEKNRGRG